jgi:outer membrane cobalamin receptor
MLTMILPLFFNDSATSRAAQNRFCFLLALMFAGFYSSAQQFVDSTVYLEEVKILGNKHLDYVAGQKTVKIDSLGLSEFGNAGIDQLLASRSTAFVKNYGPSALSSISFRGKSAVHTAVVWEDFVINPSNIAQTDFSIIQVNMFNDIALRYGGGSVLYGSGLIGGSIHLKNTPQYGRGLRVFQDFSVGSFQDYGSKTGLSYSNQKISTKSIFTYQDAKNNFTYPKYGKIETLSNAAVLKRAFIHQTAFKLKGNHFVEFDFWYQDADRQIPPTMVMDFSNATQEDKAVRTIAKWKKVFRKSALSFKAAYFYDYLHYLDPGFSQSALIDSYLRLHSLKTEAEIKMPIWLNVSFVAAMSYAKTIADIEAYKTEKTRDETAFYFTIVQAIPKINWKFSASGRYELVEGQENPLSASVGGQGRIWSFLSARFNFSRNFRIPTLNDLFWVPGGNPDLKPEISLNGEAGFDVTLFKTKSIQFNFDITAYNSMVDDWIIWLPTASGQIWSPENIQSVWSRGLEAGGNFAWTISKVEIGLSSGFTYAKSTYGQAAGNGLNYEDKELIYTPKMKYFLVFDFGYKNLHFSLNHKYTGKRFIYTDNSETMPAFWTDGVSVSWRKQIQKHMLALRFSVRNAFDQYYEVFENRPMPGRHFMFSINYSFNQKQK